jgi:hypothetical protein
VSRPEGGFWVKVQGWIMPIPCGALVPPTTGVRTAGSDRSRWAGQEQGRRVEGMSAHRTTPEHRTSTRRSACTYTRHTRGSHVHVCYDNSLVRSAHPRARVSDTLPTSTPRCGRPPVLQNRRARHQNRAKTVRSAAAGRPGSKPTLTPRRRLRPAAVRPSRITARARHTAAFAVHQHKIP